MGRVLRTEEAALLSSAQRRWAKWDEREEEEEGPPKTPACSKATTRWPSTFSLGIWSRGRGGLAFKGSSAQGSP